MLTIRPYQRTDAPILYNLVYHTVHHINKQDYSLEQLNAWVPLKYDLVHGTDAWQKKLDRCQPFIAILTGSKKIVGFADLQPNGFIHFFFCHYKYQQQGVGRALMATILTAAKQQKIEILSVHASITAKPFFERYGFSIRQQQCVEIGCIGLINFVMTKQLL